MTPGSLLPYAPRLVAEWLADRPETTHRTLTGSLLFADISGFTTLTERLARRGKVGAEELSDALDATFGALLEVARADGGDLVKWGGDAVLLLFTSSDHAARAGRAAYRMRARLRAAEDVRTSAGLVRLRMSVGIHSGRFTFFLVGDPGLHRELVVTGPDASTVCRMESTAGVGQILLSRAAADSLPAEITGPGPVPGSRLLRREPLLSDLAVPPPRADVDLSVALPGPIRAHLRMDQRQPEHRPITVAFVQFSGTDDLLRRGGPGTVAAALDEVVRNVSRTADALEVTFFESDIGPDGGKILLTAGAPRSAGRDDERMLRAAREIIDHAGTLPLRIGMTRGRVFAGDFGPPFRRTYSVKGDAVNLAARVTAKARPGQILATESVPAHSGTLFETRPIPPFQVKGKRLVVKALEVGPRLGERAGTESREESLLVGRSAELEALGSALESVHRRTGTLVEIVGEAGIGKSRLMEVLWARSTNLVKLSTRCDEYQSSIPYHVVGALLRDLLAIPPGARVDEVTERLSARVAANAPHLLPWLPLLGVVLDVDLPPSRQTAALDEDFRRSRLEDVVAEFLRCCLPTPALVLIDDAHQMDEASARLCTRIQRELASEPWLVVVSRRDQPTGFVPSPGPATVTLRPGALTHDEALVLAQTATESRPLPGPAMRALVEKAGGNPLFLEALVRAAGASGRVEDLPETVEELVTSRIDRLTPGDRAVLRCAAVLGTMLSRAELDGLLSDQGLTADASTFRRLGEFLVDDTADQRRFRHSLIRDVAYEGLPYRRRRHLHEKIALALEGSTTEQDSVVERLSLHYFHADRFDKAWAYSRDAGDRARDRYAHRDAIDYYDRAVRAARRCAPGTVEPVDLGSLLEAMGDAWFTIGVPDEADLMYRQAAAQLRTDPIRAAHLVAKQARVDQRRRRFPVSMRRLTRALHSLDGDTSAEACSARALLDVRYAFSRFSQGRVDEALAWAERAAGEAEQAADKAALARAYATSYGIYVSVEREPDLPYGRLALHAYRELDDLTGQAHCLNNLAIEADTRHRWEEAEQSYRTAAELFARIGDTANEATAVFNRADILVRQGRLHEAEPLLTDALRSARAVLDDELVALVLREAGRVAARLGRSDEGRRLLTQARERFVLLEEDDEVAATDLAVAEVLVLSGDTDDGLGLVSGIVRRGGDAALGPALARVRGFGLLDLGRTEEAARELTAALAASTEGDNRYERALCLLGLSRLPDGDAGRRDLATEAALLLDALGVVTPPVRTG